MYPTHIRPLLHSGDDRNKKEHLTKHCQKCKELGRNCRHYVPPSEPAGDDDDDNVSVRSDRSTSSVSELDDDDDDMDARQTPVPSDEEANEEFLTSKIGNLDLSGKKPK